MSLLEVERFANDMKSKAALREEAKQSGVTSLEQAVAFAAIRGYSFTLEHAESHILAHAESVGRRLSDSQYNEFAVHIGFIHPVQSLE